MAATIVSEARPARRNPVQDILCSGADCHPAWDRRGLAVAEPCDQRVVKALGDGFIKLIKMVIAPIIFCTVGIRHFAYQDPGVGRVGVKALAISKLSRPRLIPGFWVSQPDPGRSWPRRQARCGASQIRQAGGNAKSRSISSQTSFRTARSGVGARRHPAGTSVCHPVRFALMALGERGHRLRDIIDTRQMRCSAWIASS